MIRVHLIRHCYPSSLAISDMGIKCWTCFWVILGAQRATTYTPFNQWGLGFVVKPRAQGKSVFPPFSRSGLAKTLNAHFSEWKHQLTAHFSDTKRRVRVQDGSWPAPCVSTGVFLSTLGSLKSDSCVLHSGSRERTEHLNPIVKKTRQQQPNNRWFLWQRLADAAVFIICLLPPLIHTLLP